MVGKLGSRSRSRRRGRRAGRARRPRSARAARGSLVGGDEEECERSGRTAVNRVAEPVQRGARRSGHNEDAERKAAMREQREGRGGGEHHAERVERPLRTVRADKHRERQCERDGRDDAVSQPRRMRDTRSPDRCVRDAHNSPLPTRVTSLRVSGVAPEKDPRPPVGGRRSSSWGRFGVGPGRLPWPHDRLLRPPHHGTPGRHSQALLVLSPSSF